VKIQTPPSSGTGHGAENQNADQQCVFNCVEPVIVDVIFGDIERDILVRENDECVEKDPPSAQHEEIQQAEQDLSAPGEEIWPPGNGGDHRHGVEEEDDVKKKRIGNRAVKNDFPKGPGELIGGPQEECEDHERPEAALRARACEGIAGTNCERTEHDGQAGKIGEGSKRGIGSMRFEAHPGKGQSDSGRCDEPAVLTNETHSAHFMGVDYGSRGPMGMKVVTLVIGELAVASSQLSALSQGLLGLGRRAQEHNSFVQESGRNGLESRKGGVNPPLG
jgi:hypothetical protein